MRYFSAGTHEQGPPRPRSQLAGRDQLLLIHAVDNRQQFGVAHFVEAPAADAKVECLLHLGELRLGLGKQVEDREFLLR